MSKTRQRVLVRTFGVDFKAPQQFAYDAAGWDQLVYAVRGTLTVRTAEAVWVLPPLRALWVPAGVTAECTVKAFASLRSLYFARGLVRLLPRRCALVSVSPLLRELIVHAVAVGALDRAAPAEAALARVIADQMNRVDSTPLQLPMPSDARAVRAARIMLGEPTTRAVATARRAGASTRTLERLFRAETTMPLAAWRRRARLLHALHLLATGMAVTSAAIEVGYQSPSAFVGMCRRELGVTPSAYIRGTA